MAASIIGLETIRHINDLFRIELLLPEWDHNVVCNNVVNVRRAHRSRIAKVVYLDRRGSLSKNIRARTFGKPHQIDSDVDFEPANQLRDVLIGHP